MEKFLIFRKPTLKKFLYFLIFWEMEHSSFNTKKFITFSQKKLFLYCRKRISRKKSLYFRKRNFFIFQETETHKKLSRSNFTSSKNNKKNTLKNLLIFQEMELFSPKKLKLLKK